MPSAIKEKLLPVTLGKRPIQLEPNLAPFLRRGADEYELEHTVAVLRAAYARASDKEALFRDLPARDEDRDQRVLPYTASFGRLTQYFPIREVDPGQDISGRKVVSYPWVHATPLQALDDWRLVFDLEKSQEGQPMLVNWMHKGKPDSTLHMRFWFKPEFSSAAEGLVPDTWQGRFAYRSRAGALDESMRLDLKLSYRDGELGTLGDDCYATFKRWSVCNPEKSTTFVYDARANVHGIQYARQLYLVETSENLTIGPDLMRRMDGERDKSFTEEELRALPMFPNFNSDNRGIDMSKTLTDLVTAFAERGHEAVAGFKCVQFRRRY